MKPWDSGDEGVVSKLCNESGKMLVVSIDVQVNLYRVGDIPCVDGAAIDDLEPARFF